MPDGSTQYYQPNRLLDYEEFIIEDVKDQISDEPVLSNKQRKAQQRAAAAAAAKASTITTTNDTTTTSTTEDNVN
eukprot:UN06018